MSQNTIPSVTMDSTGRLISSSTKLNYQTITMNGRYKLYEDILRLSGTFAPTFGDFQRLLMETSLQYFITARQSAVLQYQYIINKASAGQSTVSKNDSFVSLIYRIDF
jgi:hypothetical protein